MKWQFVDKFKHRDSERNRSEERKKEKWAEVAG